MIVVFQQILLGANQDQMELDLEGVLEKLESWWWRTCNQRRFGLLAIVVIGKVTGEDNDYSVCRLYVKLYLGDP
jgi:hypothetical protein